MTNIIRFPQLRSKSIDKEFETFLDDFGGFVLAVKATTGQSWEKLAELSSVSIGTLKKLADRDYIRGPTLSTFYKVARVLDKRSIIKHSMYTKWHGFTRAQAKKLDKALGTTRSGT